MESTVLFGVSWLRSSLFTAESLMLPLAEAVATKKLPRLPFTDFSLFVKVQKSLHQLLRQDAERISQGYYPASVLLRSEPAVDPLSHLQRLPRIFREAVDASRRRVKKRTKDFSEEARLLKDGLPEYYQRNFHFQRDGYLGEESAALYDHQVEILFAGSADAMRRLLIAPLKRHFERTQGRGLRILELGCGSGSATNFLRLAFPQARITAVDLSEPYLEVARKRVPTATFVPAAAEDLPFKDGEFDAVVSVFLFHELPLEVREKVLAESRRVLKAGGIFAYVDSLQLGDEPELDEPLKAFPTNFHEPFYPNYVRHPMEELLQAAGFRAVERGLGFFSKMQAAVAYVDPLVLPALKAVNQRARQRPVKKAKAAGPAKKPRRPAAKKAKTAKRAKR